MQYRPLGNTGLSVSEISLGCASFWGRPSFSEKEAIRLVHTAADRGVTLFDTGSNYNAGNAELRLSKALDGLPQKHDLIISTKAGTRGEHHGNYRADFSPSWIRHSVETSLQRLKLDALPLLQLHGPRLFHFTDELLSLLHQLKTEGKVRYIGVNSFNDNVIRHIMNHPLFEVVMLDYNILPQPRGALIAELANRGIGVLAGRPLASGLYDIKRFMTPNLRNAWYVARTLRRNPRDILRGAQFRFINRIEGMSGAQVALAWVLKNPHISSAVLGTTQMPHLLENIAVSGGSIDSAVLTRIHETRKTA